MSKPNKKKMSLKKKLLIGVTALAVVSSAALIGVGNFLVDYAVGRSGDGGNRQVSLAVENTASTTGMKYLASSRQTDKTNLKAKRRPLWVGACI